MNPEANPYFFFLTLSNNCTIDFVSPSLYGVTFLGDQYHIKKLSCSAPYHEKIPRFNIFIFRSFSSISSHTTNYTTDNDSSYRAAY